MSNHHPYILWFDQIKIEDTALVGGKNAALGEMYQFLKPKGINVPNGFAVSAQAFRYFLKHNDLDEKIKNLLSDFDINNVQELQKRGQAIRDLVIDGEFPEDLKKEIFDAYEILGKQYKKLDVAVRSSATAEDLPGSSFAGQQETYLNVRGKYMLMDAVKKCFASLFTNRAISYRHDRGFAQEKIALSVGVQKMVRSDKASSGVIFTIDPETGLKNVIYITGSWGLGEIVVQGQVSPDEFYAFKPGLKAGYASLISKKLGSKEVKIVYDEYGSRGTKRENVELGERKKFILEDKEILQLAKWSLLIEEHFSKKAGEFRPMDIEWAKDGISEELFIVQARPETVQATKDPTKVTEYILKGKGNVLVSGKAVGSKIAKGEVRIIKSAEKMSEFKTGEVLVTEMTDPDWEPIMKEAAAIITNKGGRTSHAAIVSRELGIPAIVGTKNATQILENGQKITVDCSPSEIGIVYDGFIEFETKEYSLKKIPDIKTKIMVNIGSPDQAFEYHYLPVKGVGLAREEFIIASEIQIHPNLLLNYEKLKSQITNNKPEKSRGGPRVTSAGSQINREIPNSRLKKILKKVDDLTEGYDDKKEYYVDKLASGVAKIGAAFWPNPVIVRFSDFKTNEYRTLIGGELYEPEESNPMLGWRGASRYYDPRFKDAFILECHAIKKVREIMGLTNIKVMVPFCRTPEEGKKVMKIMNETGLERGKKDLEVYVMCEIPSNVIQAYEFLEIFDGFSIGSNDLAQLTLGMDRDNEIIANIANENNDSVKELIRIAIKVANELGKYSGICGQAPSDYPDFAKFLIKNKIKSISLNPDTIIKTIENVAKWEKEER